MNGGGPYREPPAPSLLHSIESAEDALTRARAKLVDEIRVSLAAINKDKSYNSYDFERKVDALNRLYITVVGVHR